MLSSFLAFGVDGWNLFHSLKLWWLLSSHVSISLSEFLHSKFFFRWFSKWPSLLRFKLIMFLCHRHFQPTSSQLCNFLKSSNFRQNSSTVWCWRYKFEIYPLWQTNQSFCSVKTLLQKKTIKLIWYWVLLQRERDISNRSGSNLLWWKSRGEN